MLGYAMCNHVIFNEKRATDTNSIALELILPEDVKEHLMNKVLHSREIDNKFGWILALIHDHDRTEKKRIVNLVISVAARIVPPLR